MDHKRGHGASDHMHESTRIKRHKDLSYQQPSNALATTFSIFSPQPVAHRHTSADFDQRDKVQLASLERLRAIADNSAQCVDKLCGCSLQSNIEKSVEEVIYEEYLPVVLSQLAARSDQSSTLPLLLTDKNAEIQCAICPDEKRFKSLQKDEDFKDEVDQYALLNPSCRKQVKKQLSVLEEQLRKDRLIWLQEVETVRQQFQHMADAVHDEQVERDAATMRIEKHMEKRMRTFDEHQLMRKEYFMTRKVINLHNCKRLRREVEMKHLMDLWREEQQDFERESKYARSVKEKLESTHMKSHFKDHLSQQGEQLKKGQQWSSDEDTVVGRQMFHHNFN